MLQTKIISDRLCAVAFDPSHVYVRDRGKMYFGSEKCLTFLKDDVLTVDVAVAAEYGIKIEVIHNG